MSNISSNPKTMKSTLVIQNNDPNFGNIFIGSIESLDSNFIEENKIKGFINVSNNLDLNIAIVELNYNLVIPVEQSESENLSNYIDISLKFLEKYQNKTNIVVACADGKTLSTIVLIAFLMKFFRYDFEKAYEAFSSNRKILDKDLVRTILAKAFPNLNDTKPKLEQKVLKDRTNLTYNVMPKNTDTQKLSNLQIQKEHNQGFNKAHSIESYKKNIEPELKFEDINCIVQPNENNVGGIYLGNFNAAKDLKLLNSLNIFAVLTVAEELEHSYKNNEMIAHLKIMASDIENFDLSKHFIKCFEFIGKFQASTNILIHCYAGVSRSVTITIAFLMKFHRMSFKQALSLVRGKRKQIYPNSGFINQLKFYEKVLLWERNNN